MEEWENNIPDRIVGSTAVPYHIPPKSDKPSHSYINQIRRDWTLEDQSYQARNKKSEQQIEATRNDKNANPRLAAYNKFIDTFKNSSMTDSEKASAVNNWVNSIIHYDHNKPRPSNLNDWHQTPFQTLSTGLGVCSDIARLKYQMLKDAGVNESKMRLVDGMVYGADGKYLDAHEVLLFNDGTQNYILNDDMVDEGWTPEMYFADAYMQLSDIFVPLLNSNGQGVWAFPAKVTPEGCYILKTGPGNRNSEATTPQDGTTDGANDASTDTTAPNQQEQFEEEERQIQDAWKLNPSQNGELANQPATPAANTVEANAPICHVHFEGPKRPDRHHKSSAAKKSSHTSESVNASPAPGS